MTFLLVHSFDDDDNYLAQGTHNPGLGQISQSSIH